jgi:DnaJ-class molecular chaperone
MTVQDKGLPFHKKPYEFGNLFILFHVKFPESLNDAQISEVSTTLKAMKKQNLDAEMDASEVCKLQTFSEDQKNTHC